MPGESILIVEDEKATGWALAQTLKEDGYETIVVGSSEDALKHLSKKACDLLVTDVRLPGMNGVDLVKALRKDPPSPPAIVITAYATQELRDKAAKAGADAWFVKPFNVRQLKQKIAALLESRTFSKGR
jgi:DNA-binding response OmpR family regulator